MLGRQALNPTMDDWRKRLSWMSRRLDAVKAKSPPAQLPPSASTDKQVPTTPICMLTCLLYVTKWLCK